MLYAIDTETDIQFLPGPTTLVCLSWATLDGDAGLLSRNEVEDWMLARFRAKDQLVLTNAAFDMTALLVNFPALTEHIFQAYDLGLIKDTLVRSWLFTLASGEEESPKKPSHSLIAQVERFLGYTDAERAASKKDKDAWRYRYVELLYVPIADWPKEASEYAIQDAKDTLAVYQAQCQTCPTHSTTGVYPSEDLIAASHFAMYLTSAKNPFKRDFAWIRGLSEISSEKAAAVLEQQCQVGLARKQKKKGEVVVVRDMEAWREAITKAYNGNPPRNPPTEKMRAKGITEGNIMTDRKTILRTGDLDLIEMSGEGWLKVESTYLPALRQTRYTLDNGRVITRRDVSPDYSMAVMTGRSSISGQCPLHQFPKDKGVRESFIAEPGHAFVFTDLASSESVCLAETMCQYLETDTCHLKEVLGSGKDVHCYTGFFIAQSAEPGRFASYEDLHEAYLAGDKTAKKYRTFAKPVNHGGGGGLGAGALRDFAAGHGIFMTHQEAKTVLDAWKRAFNDVYDYFAWVTSQEDFVTGEIATRIWTTGRIRGGMRYTSACNNGFQASAADGKRASLFMLVREQMCKGHYQNTTKRASIIPKVEWVPGQTTALHGTRLMLEMHDELITQCRLADTKVVAKRQEELLKLGIQVFMKHCAELVGADSTFAVRWTKQATADEIFYGPHEECRGCTKPKVECPKCWGIK